MDDSTATNLTELTHPQVDPTRADPALPMYLIVLAGGIPGAMIRLAPGVTRVGRAADNTLQLSENSVSRYHAVIRSDDDGRVRLTDLASTNGTYLNGRRMGNHAPEVIHDGDRIQFGSMTVLKFVRPDPYEELFQHTMFERTVRDGLTGLYNRSYFLDQVGPLAAQAAQRGLGLAVLMIDIDHFKHVNDNFGHEAGDGVLREAACVIRQATRTEDLVARYGGEEFIVALPTASTDLARARAERIRRNVAGRRICAGGHPLRITVSIGLAYATARCPRSVDSLIAAADLCLYEAKNTGRDRVVAGQVPVPHLPEPPTRDDQNGSAAAPELLPFVNIAHPHPALTSDREA